MDGRRSRSDLEALRWTWSLRLPAGQELFGPTVRRLILRSTGAAEVQRLCRIPIPDGRSRKRVPGPARVQQSLAAPRLPPCYPAIISFMRLSSSSGGTSFTCVEIIQRWPEGSSTIPDRSP